MTAPHSDLPRRSLARRLARPVLFVLAVIYIASFIAVFRASRQDQRRPADAIVVLGAAQYNGKPSPVLRARLDHALILYQEHLAPVIVVTGGIGEGDRVSEASVGQQYLVAHGVAETDVVVRPEGRSTEASMASVAGWLRERSLSDALLVSDPFHSLRLRLESRRVDVAAFTSPTTTSPISQRSTSELPYLMAEALKIPVVWLRSLF